VTHSSRRIVLAAIGLVALAFGPFATYQLTRTAERSPALLLADVAVGWSMIAAGLLIADRRPGNRIGPLAIVTGFAWFVGDFTSSDVALVSYAANLAHGWFDPLFALVILAYPSGRIERRIDRSLAIGFIAVQAAWTVAKAYGMRPIGWWDCPTCISTVDAWIAADDAMDPLGRVETLALTALSVGVLLAVANRWLGATGAARQRLAPVVVAGVVLAVGFVVTFLLQTVVPTSAREPLGELRVILLAVLRVLVAVGLVIGVLRTDAARGRIADLVIRLDRLPPMSILQASLQDALGDPSLAVYRWEPATASFVDAAGHASTPPDADGSGRTVLTIGDGAEPDLVIAHDPSLRNDPGLVSAATAAVRLAVENERLQAEVRAQLESVRASRARIVEAQDDERRRIERDLHDGAQQRLVSLQLSLQMLRRGLGPGTDAATLAELDAATAEATAAIADIRELARGVHPAILSEAGLGAALASLADRTPLPVVIDDEVASRLPAPVEATAYFVVAEALTNAIKHADAARVDVRTWVDDDRLRLVISDDGRGGADPDGSGLTGIRDRVAALGGTVRIESKAGAGTRLEVDLPCGSS